MSGLGSEMSNCVPFQPVCVDVCSRCRLGKVEKVGSREDWLEREGDG